MTQRLDGWIPLATVLLVAAAAQAQDTPAAPEQPAPTPAPQAPQAAPPATAQPTQAPATPTTPAEQAPAAPAAPAPEPTPAPAPDDASAAGSVSLDPGAVAAEADADTDTDADAEVSEEPPADEDVEEIVITGSRVSRRSAFAASAPVEIISREDLEYSGATNLADVVQYLTVAQGSGFQGEGGALGTNSINLRGLGEGNTLVLINGRRVAPSGGGVTYHFVDIGAIPMTAVERIEILKGGASAIYGSDAVAGVVNIITRKDWDGFKAEVDAQTTDKLDQRDYTVSGSFGATSERSRLTLSLQYFNRSQLTASERDWTERADPTSTTGFPGSYLVGFGVMPDPDCEEGPQSELLETDTGAFCGFNLRPFLSLMGNMERTSIYGHGEYDVTNHTSIFTELNVARTRTDGIFSPSFPIPPPFPTVPGDHVDNPFGQDVGFIGRPLGAEAGPKTNTSADETLRAAVGFRGDFEDAFANSFAEDWKWELYATAGASRFRNIIHDVILEELQQALNSCGDPTDLSGCFNPFYSSVLGTGTPNSAEVISTFDSAMENLTDHAQQTYNAGISGTLFELPGGDLGFALGGEVRHESRASYLDHDATQLRYAFVVGNSGARVDREVYGAYGELVWPLYHGIEVQTAGRIDKYSDTDATSASPTVGLTFTPGETFGTTDETWRFLQFRGHLAGAFRAPTIYQTFPGFTVAPQLFQPEGAPLPQFISVQRFGNPDLEPETATAMSAGMQWRPRDWLMLSVEYWQYDYADRIASQNATQIARTDLDARANDPDWVPGPVSYGPDDSCPFPPCIERVSANQINTGDVFTNGIDFSVLLKATGETFGGNEDDFGTISLAASGTYTLSYEIDQGSAAPLADEDGNLLREDPDDADSDPLYDEDCDGDVCDIVGKRNSTNFAVPLPVLRLNLPLSWTMDGHMLSAIGHYIAGFEDDAVANADGTLPEVDAMITLDLQYGYTLDDTVGKELSFRVGVYNVFDEEPPATSSSGLSLTGYESGAHDPRGRMLYAKLIQEF